ncbi:hypothetical protein Pryu01_02843 [Paraliobacillus ryukyuensis]|uniref:Cupin domain n=1 Tax=Paraliobacillus ryukyuensis TaxID=200904 RepID=A0A366E8K3_9BACI|nr:cupin domain-containing protein [Paraliobacillus ryukyuensis]RBO98089.1 cupin domain [Paraliobacillus ryukyuensis]
MKKNNLATFIAYGDTQFSKKIISKEENSTAFMLNFLPGQALPAHRHPGSTVYLQVITGKGTFTIDNQATVVTEQDILSVTGDEELAFVNDGAQPTSIYVVLTRIPSEAYAKDI